MSLIRDLQLHPPSGNPQGGGGLAFGHFFEEEAFLVVGELFGRICFGKIFWEDFFWDMFGRMFLNIFWKDV